MLLFVAALVAATCAAGAWCVSTTVAARLRNRSLSVSEFGAIAALLALTAGAAWLRVSLAAPHHAMYLDEPWYAETACNLARIGRPVLCQEEWSGRNCTPLEKAWGWPVVMSPWVMLAGCHPSTGIYINRVLGALTVALVAVAARCAGAGWWPSVIAAALLAIHPIHIAWSATGETNVPAAAALLAGMCGALVYLRTGRLCGAALAVSGLGLSTAIRPESASAALAAAVVLALAAASPRRRRVSVGGAIAVVTGGAAVTALRLWSMNEAISGGSFLAIRNIASNLSAVAGSPRLRVYALVVLLALGGAAVVARSSQQAVAWLLACTALVGALVTLAYDRFHERMLLGSLVCLLPLAAFVFDARFPIAEMARWRRLVRPLAALAVVLLTLWLSRDDLAAVPGPTEPQILETRIAARVAELSLPADALFIAEKPPVLAASGMRHVMTTERALSNVQQLRARIGGDRPIYFLCDMFCEPEFQTGSVPACSQMFENFALSPVAEETINMRTYGLYRIGAATDDGSPSRRCPRPD